MHVERVGESVSRARFKAGKSMKAKGVMVEMTKFNEVNERCRECPLSTPLVFLPITNPSNTGRSLSTLASIVICRSHVRSTLCHRPPSLPNKHTLSHLKKAHIRTLNTSGSSRHLVWVSLFPEPTASLKLVPETGMKSNSLPISVPSKLRLYD